MYYNRLWNNIKRGEIVEHLLEKIVHYVAYIMEIIGIFIIIMSGFKALTLFIKGKFAFNNPRVSLILAQGMNIALGFLLAAEISLSIIVKTVPNLIVLVGIAGLRVGLTFVLHWEMHETEKLCAENEEMCKIDE